MRFNFVKLKVSELLVMKNVKGFEINLYIKLTIYLVLDTKFKINTINSSFET